MPCHPDRVRRNYHNINIITNQSTQFEETTIHISISKAAIASCMSKQEIRRELFRIINKGIDSWSLIK